MNFNLGEKVSVKSNKKEMIGTIYYANQSFVTVQFPNYKESFLNVDISRKIVKIDRIKD